MFALVPHLLISKCYHANMVKIVPAKHEHASIVIMSIQVKAVPEYNPTQQRQTLCHIHSSVIVILSLLSHLELRSIYRTDSLNVVFRANLLRKIWFSHSIQTVETITHCGRSCYVRVSHFHTVNRGPILIPLDPRWLPGVFSRPDGSYYSLSGDQRSWLQALYCSTCPLCWPQTLTLRLSGKNFKIQACQGYKWEFLVTTCRLPILLQSGQSQVVFFLTFDKNDGVDFR